MTAHTGRAARTRSRTSCPTALHERLTQRFVDRRTATLVSRLRAGGELLAAIKPDGTVLVEGEIAGRLEGFHFRLDSAIPGGAIPGGAIPGAAIPGGAISGLDAKPLLTAVRPRAGDRNPGPAGAPGARR